MVSSRLFVTSDHLLIKDSCSTCSEVVFFVLFWAVQDNTDDLFLCDLLIRTFYILLTWHWYSFECFSSVSKLLSCWAIIWLDPNSGSQDIRTQNVIGRTRRSESFLSVIEIQFGWGRDRVSRSVFRLGSSKIDDIVVWWFVCHGTLPRYRTLYELDSFSCLQALDRVPSKDVFRFSSL